MNANAHRILCSPAFEAEAARSERLRLVWMIIVVAAAAALAAVRSAFGPLARSGELLALALGFGAAVLIYEIAQLVLVNRRIRAALPLPQWTWPVTVVIESLIPTLAIVFLTRSHDIGPYRALLAPIILLYLFIIMLATLRLRPGLCVLAGIVSMAGYGAALAWTYAAFADHPNRAGAFPPGVYLTAMIFIGVAGAVAAVVCTQIRNRLLAAIDEMQQRQRAQMAARDTLIFGLAKLAEYRDTDTGAHLERIAAYSRLLAETLGADLGRIDEDWVNTIRVASSLHDIGKVGIPDSVLKKPGKLTDEERTVMQNHTKLGAEAIAAIRERHGPDALLEMSEQIAAAHHERWDGAGYPAKLAGEHIPLAARIVSVADVYDALTSARVYKPPFSHEEAKRMLTEARGSQFDPQVIDAFVRIERRFNAVRAQLNPVNSSNESQ